MKTGKLIRFVGLSCDEILCTISNADLTEFSSCIVYASTGTAVIRVFSKSSQEGLHVVGLYSSAVNLPLPGKCWIIGIACQQQSDRLPDWEFSYRNLPDRLRLSSSPELTIFAPIDTEIFAPRLYPMPYSHSHYLNHEN